MQKLEWGIVWCVVQGEAGGSAVILVGIVW